MQANYSHDWAGERFQLLIHRRDDFRRELIELGLRVAFALAQENESSDEARPFILSSRFAEEVR